MPTEVIHMWGTGSGGTENAVASIDIPFDGRISAIDIAFSAGVNADTEESAVELSFIATNQIATNDARGVLVSARARLGLLTSGAGVVSVNRQVMFEDLRVSGGERVHMHMVATAGVSSFCSMDIHLETTQARRRSARRRQ